MVRSMEASLKFRELKKADQGDSDVYLIPLSPRSIGSVIRRKEPNTVPQKSPYNRKRALLESSVYREEPHDITHQLTRKHPMLSPRSPSSPTTHLMLLSLSLLSSLPRMLQGDRNSAVVIQFQVPHKRPTKEPY